MTGDLPPAACQSILLINHDQAADVSAFRIAAVFSCGQAGSMRWDSLLGLLVLFVAVQATDRPNVLFIVAGDFRPELVSYELKHFQLPNKDRLTKRLYANMGKTSSPKEKK